MLETVAILRWLHILAMVYWLGGEWGVFHSSRHVIDRQLGMDERRRHMETAYRIDILARSGIILLFPLGMHMGYYLGVQPYGGMFLTLMWVFFLAWLGLCWAAFIHRETDTGLQLTVFDERIRYFVIPALMLACVSSWLGNGPFENGTGQLWFSTKVFIFSLLLIIGLKLRFIMREWTVLFRVLEQKGGDAAVEATLHRSLSLGRLLAYFYWIGIAFVAFLGATKPF